MAETLDKEDTFLAVSFQRLIEFTPDIPQLSQIGLKFHMHIRFSWKTPPPSIEGVFTVLHALGLANHCAVGWPFMTILISVLHKLA